MAIGPFRTSDLVSRFLHLSQSNVYQIKFALPSTVITHLQSNGFNYNQEGENVELLCQNAVLPGTSLSTHEVVGDFQGVRERMAYRRMYDDAVDLTFYVDHDYKVPNLFDGWVDYISGQGEGQRLSDANALSPAANYRLNYPYTYRSNVYIVKFEKDVSSNETIFKSQDTYSLTYCLVQAFPVNIVSTPISYDGNDIMKYTVSMAFTRYTMKKDKITERND